MGFYLESTAKRGCSTAARQSCFSGLLKENATRKHRASAGGSSGGQQSAKEQGPKSGSCTYPGHR